tara:strand:- start:39070 stop:40251 length:1182 start_codon:yes stop_codon:yes gene_type:complete
MNTMTSSMTNKSESLPVNEHESISRFHGGGLNAAAKEFNIPREQWLDLSTGINPNGYPINTLPTEVWQRLPEEDDDLEAIALAWFGRSSVNTHVDPHDDKAPATGCLPVAGSQAALQLLPSMRAPCRVGVPAVGYAEHEFAWRAAGHDVTRLLPDEVGSALARLDVLICINPNNPSGEIVCADTLIGWHRQLSARGGWLVVDEAFMDMPVSEEARSKSLADYYFQLRAAQQNSGLIILRSLGKFFGLAGMRAGLMFAEPALCVAMKDRLGPWALSHPARYVMARALADVSWQAKSAEQLRQQRQRLVGLLRDAGFMVQGYCDLFVYCPHPFAQHVATALAQQAVWVRYFDQPAALRFGLPGNEVQWQQLTDALTVITSHPAIGANVRQSVDSR